jgi:hypothetical protein
MAGSSTTPAIVPRRWPTGPEPAQPPGRIGRRAGRVRPAAVNRPGRDIGYTPAAFIAGVDQSRTISILKARQPVRRGQLRADRWLVPRPVAY